MADLDNRHAVLVSESRRIKENRTALEAAGYYDSSRRIRSIKPNSFALPVTATCAKLLAEKEGMLPDPKFADFCLIRADLPKSKKCQVKTEWESLREAITDFFDDLNTNCSSELDCESRAALVSELPKTWEQHGDLVVLPHNSFTSPIWQTFGGIVWETVAQALKCKRLALDRKVLCDQFRTSGTVLVLGEDGWVEHVDNCVRYVFDVTKCMFSSGNITEKLRITGLDCTGETVVDLYAGIGYFTLPYLVHTGAVVVHACEWNPDAVEGLKRGLAANGVEDRCIIHFGDNRKMAPRGVANRVNLGLLPSSEAGWPVACAALNPASGGWLHVHGNVCSKPGNHGFAESNPWSNQQDPVALWSAGQQSSSKTETSDAGLDPDEEGLTSYGSGTAKSLCGAERNISGIESVDTDVLKSVIGASKHAEEQQALRSEDGPRGYNLDMVGENVQGVSISDHLFTLKKPSVKRTVWQKWAFYVAERVHSLLALENPLPSGGQWSVCVQHVEHVKSYAPHVDHLVADVECRPLTV